MALKVIKRKIERPFRRGGGELRAHLWTLRILRILRKLDRNLTTLGRKIDIYNSGTASRKCRRATIALKKEGFHCSTRGPESRSPSYASSPPPFPLVPQSHSTFTRLPTELRLIIYKHLLQADEQIEDPGPPHQRDPKNPRSMPKFMLR